MHFSLPFGVFSSCFLKCFQLGSKKKNQLVKWRFIDSLTGCPVKCQVLKLTKYVNSVKNAQNGKFDEEFCKKGKKKNTYKQFSQTHPSAFHTKPAELFSRPLWGKQALTSYWTDFLQGARGCYPIQSGNWFGHRRTWQLAEMVSEGFG